MDSAHDLKKEAAALTAAREKEIIDERRKRLKTIYLTVHERMRRSRVALENKNPAYSYYFGNINPDEMAIYHSLGFEVDKDPTVKGSLDRQADGSLRVGDVILLRMPAEEYEAIQNLNALKSETNLDAAIERLTEEMARSQVPTFGVEKET